MVVDGPWLAESFALFEYSRSASARYRFEPAFKRVKQYTNGRYKWPECEREHAQSEVGDRCRYPFDIWLG